MAQMREAVRLVVKQGPNVIAAATRWPHTIASRPRVFPPTPHQVQERCSGQEAWGPLLAPSQQSSGAPKLSAPPWPARMDSSLSWRSGVSLGDSWVPVGLAEKAGMTLMVTTRGNSSPC